MPLGLPLLLIAGLLTGWALLVLFTCWLLTHPPRRTYAFAVARSLPGDPSELAIAAPDGTLTRGLAFTQWTLRSRGVDLPVWDVRGLNPDGPTIILTHGWGDSRVVMLGRIAALAPMASRLVAWDLPAHGDAPRGRFSLGSHEYVDLIELYDRVSRPEATTTGPSPRVVLYGFSLGAGVSIQAASELSARGSAELALPAAIIAEAPYRIPLTPARNVLRMRAMPYRSNIVPAIWLLTLRFGRRFAARNFDRARMQTRVPLLLLHGTLDPICRIQDSRDIAAALPRAQLREIAGGGHGNLWSEPATAAAARDAVQSFLETQAMPDTNSPSHALPLLAASERPGAHARA